MNKPNCYDCKWRGDVPGDAHSCCRHPEVANKDDNPFGALTQLLGGAFNAAILKLKIVGNSHGIQKGWFFWPANFDPVWLENCDGFEAKQNPASTKAFTLIEVMVCVAIVAILAVLIYGSAMRHRAQKQAAKVEQEAKPFERFTFERQETKRGEPSGVLIITDTRTRDEYLLIEDWNGSGSAVAATIVRLSPVKHDGSFGLNVTNFNPWTQRP